MGIRDGWSAAQVRDAEQPLLAAGVPLMARAAADLAAEVERLLERRGRRRGHLLVLAGSGSNGGDALHATASLLQRGWSAEVALLGRRVHAGGLRAAARAGVRVLPPDVPVGRLVARAADAGVVLVGVLGTGAAASPGLRGPARRAFAALTGVLAGGPPVVAVDLPSGIGPDDGSVHLPVLRTTATVTFGAVKAGLLLHPARGRVGELRLVDIGLGPHLAGEPLVLADSTRPGRSGTFIRER
ncbi:NAD(P)H-hydrate epimerase [Amnibacterium endophyticum]|uniref:NAD(P)H-hydrate epimerase n=1 Tax=Amnibacterium endophyticum TaxID=2109337 RepID=A0ABW4LFH1_9MICO